MSINLQSRELLPHTPGLKPDDLKNKAEICGHGMNLTPQQQKDVWWQTRAVVSFDGYLGYGASGPGINYKNWVRNLDMKINKKGQSGWDCATLVGGSGCGDTNMKCGKFLYSQSPMSF
jgi:hypothetical protein